MQGFMSRHMTQAGRAWAQGPALLPILSSSMPNKDEDASSLTQCPVSALQQQLRHYTALPAGRV